MNSLVRSWIYLFLVVTLPYSLFIIVNELNSLGLKVSHLVTLRLVLDFEKYGKMIR